MGDLCTGCEDRTQRTKFSKEMWDGSSLCLHVPVVAVRVTGMAVALIDVAVEYKEDFNRWYDLDHLPEHVSKVDVLAGRRYVATEGLRGLADAAPAEFTGGHPPYLTTYIFGGPLDFLSEEALQGWADKDRDIVKAGRFWGKGHTAHSSFWRLQTAVARPSMPIHRDAVPHLPHQGVILCFGRVPPGSSRADALAWWERTQLPEHLDTPGVLAVLVFHSAENGDPDTLLHVLLCEAPVDVVMGELSRRRHYQRMTGRFPAHRSEYEEIALLPYARLVPFQTEFAPAAPSDAKP